MFVYNAHADKDQSQPLWQACLKALQAKISSTQIELWLKAIEPVSLVRTYQGESTRIVLTCQTKQIQKIKSIVSQYQLAIEQQCQILCGGYTVDWVLNATAAHQLNISPQGSLLELAGLELDDPYETNTNNPTHHLDDAGHQNNLALQPTLISQPATHAPVLAALQPSNLAHGHVTGSTLHQNSLNHSLNQSQSQSQSQNQNQNQNSAQTTYDAESNNPNINPHAGTGLNSRLSFENFLVGKANQMAHAAAQHVAQHPGMSYNPFFLYGGVGLGKTHLIHAIGNVVLANNPNARIRYVHANQFIADVVGSYRRHTFDAFKRYYHGLDLLLIDDIQFFADKKRTQEELFYAFEALVSNRSQIILTSDTYPKDLIDIETRLISRFSAGLIAALDAPELELRVFILQEKAKLLAIDLQEDVAIYIAKHLRANVRELEGALHKLLAYSRFQNSHITLEMAKVALCDLISGPRNLISAELIQKVVADYYKVKLSDMCGKRRLASLVLPRHIAMYLMKTYTQKTFSDIGALFGGRDHATALNAVRKIYNALEQANNPNLSHQIHVIQQTLGV